MAPQLIILQGGEDVKKRTNESLIKNVREISVSKKIMVIPWTTNSREQELEYRSIFNKYFSDNGFLEVQFLEKEDDEGETAKKFDMVDVVYLPGGDPGILYKELKKRSLQNMLKNFGGIIIGNSAGAIVLSKGAGTGEQFHPGFGLVDFFISVHYSMVRSPNDGNDEKININIPGDMWITVT